VFGQAGERDAGGFVIVRHVDFAPVECCAIDGLGGDVDVGVGACQRVELDGRHRMIGVFARFTRAVGEVEFDVIALDGDESGAFDGLVACEIGKRHGRHHNRCVPAPKWNSRSLAKQIDDPGFCLGTVHLRPTLTNGLMASRANWA